MKPIYFPNFITDEIHDFILNDIDSHIWSNELKRRVQHYGYKYDYTKRNINLSMKVGELLPWMRVLGEDFIIKQICKELPDQVIINEYQPGQGIYKHVDCEPCFKNVIISLSLNSGCVMEFTHLKTSKIIEFYLEPKSLLVLKNEFRYQWMHGIPARKYDYSFERKRRISVTFRNVILCDSNF